MQGEAYDWNGAVSGIWSSRGVASLLDETLRDGLQNPSGFDPPVHEKLVLLHQMEELGIDVANVGLPAASARQFEHSLAACLEIRNSALRLHAAAAGRTVIADLARIAEISQRAGIAVVATTIAASRFRTHYGRSRRAPAVFMQQRWESEKGWETFPWSCFC